MGRDEMREASDEALLAGFGTGEEAAAAIFVRRFQGRVFGLAWTMLRDEAAAADIAQEAFLRAWRHAGAYDSRRGSVITWLLTITRNLAIDNLRMHRSRPTTHLDAAMLDQLITGEVGPDHAAVVDDDVARARTALQALPEAQRRALVLASVGGRTAQEVADLEAIPLGTAKTRIRSALIRLRETLLDAEEADRG
jgi:RNA polymerase sigma-70 factor (ECF subfamily)